MIPVVTDFLKTAVGEDLKKLLAPAALVPAALFVIVHLVVVLPVLQWHGVAGVGSFGALDPAYQTLIAFASVLVIGYIAATLNGATLAFLTGDSWVDAPVLGKAGHRIQRRARDRLTARVAQLKREALDLEARRKAAGRAAATRPVDGGVTTPVVPIAGTAGSAGEAETRWRSVAYFKEMRYPSAERLLAPTALGNVIAARAGALWDRYGTDLTVLWPRLESVMSDDVLKKRLAESKAFLDLAVNVVALAVVFALEALFIGARLEEPTFGFVGFALAATVGYLAYRLAISAAFSWTDALEAAFDLHRETLASKLELRDPKDRDDEREIWSAVSGLLAWGVPADHAFKVGKPKPVNDVAIESSNNVVVQQIDRSAVTRKDLSVGDSKRVRTWFEEHFLIVRSEADEGSAVGRTAFVVVTDKRGVQDHPPVVPRLDHRLSGGVSMAGTVLSRKEPAGLTLLWRLEGLAPADAAVLRYEVPVRRCTFEVLPATVTFVDEPVETPERGEEGAMSYSAHFRADASADRAELTINDTDLPAGAFYAALDRVPIEGVRTETTVTFEFQCLQEGEHHLTVRFKLPNAGERSKDDQDG